MLNLLNHSELKQFEQHIKRRTKNNLKESLHFFNYYRLGKKDLLKKELGTNAYNVSKKRMYDRIVDFKASLILEQEVDEELQIIKLIVVSRSLLNEGQLIGFKFLHKAKKKAISIQHFSLLNEIYYLLIANAHLDKEIDLQTLIQENNSNKAKLELQIEANTVLARIREQFMQLEKGSGTTIKTILEESQSLFQQKEWLNYAFISQVIQSLDLIAEYQRDYHGIQSYLKHSIKQLTKQVSDKRTIKDKLDVHYYYANILFRIGLFSECKEQLLIIQHELESYPKINPHYLPRYLLLSSLNENYSGNVELAIEMIELIGKTAMKKYQLQRVLVNAMIYAQQEQWNQAHSEIKQLQRSDNYYLQELDTTWLLNKLFLEIIIYIELEYFDLVESRIRSFERKFSKILKSQAYQQVKPFLSIIRWMIQQSHLNVNKLSAKLETTIPWEAASSNDIFYKSFYAWMKAKVEGRNLYEVTLELVS